MAWKPPEEIKHWQPLVVYFHLEVSKNGGTPKASMFNGDFHCKPSIVGYPSIYGNHIWDPFRWGISQPSQAAFQLGSLDLSCGRWGKTPRRQNYRTLLHAMKCGSNDKVMFCSKNVKVPSPSKSFPNKQNIRRCR